MARCIGGSTCYPAMLRLTALALLPGRGRCTGDRFHASALLPAPLRCRRCSPYLVEDAVAQALFRRLCWLQPPRPLYLGQQHEPAKYPDGPQLSEAVLD